MTECNIRVDAEAQAASQRLMEERLALLEAKLGPEPLSSQLEEQFEWGPSKAKIPDAAKQAASKLPPTSDPYALALRAIAMGQIDTARAIFDFSSAEIEAQHSLVRLYKGRGLADFYSQHFPAASRWFCKAANLAEDDFEIWRWCGIAHEESADFEEAERAFSRALSLIKGKYGNRTEEYAILINDLSRAASRRGDHNLAMQLLREEEQIFIHLQGPDHWRLAVTYQNIGDRLAEQGEIASAHQHYVRAIKLLEQSESIDALEVLAAAEISLAKLYEPGAFEDAAIEIELLQSALEHTAAALGDQSREAAMTKTALGNAARRAGDIGRSEAIQHEALALLKLIHGNEHPDIGAVENNLGLTLFDKGNYHEARRLFTSAKQIAEKHFPENHPRIAEPIQNMAMIDFELGETERAIAGLRTVIEMDEAWYGTSSPRGGFTRSILALILFDAGQTKEALEELTAAENAFVAFPPEHPVRAALSDLRAGALRKFEENLVGDDSG